MSVYERYVCSRMRVATKPQEHEHAVAIDRSCDICHSRLPAILNIKPHGCELWPLRFTATLYSLLWQSVLQWQRCHLDPALFRLQSKIWYMGSHVAAIFC
ncbi:hypothetical protein VTK73DRAFT_3248 [Phialemonium thermophilum]|uniref:Uncharacterized protein n=1 Tax=Phialemonium thermophilum TaxID=223376 RepID=A0ABR3Y8A6_9PEZI